MEFLNKWIPKLWAMLWLIIITGVSLGAAIFILKWIINLIGVGA